MTQERVDALEQAGFVFDSHAAAWETMYAELCTFLQENGHTNVPSNYADSKLSVWVKAQRRQYKSYWEQDSKNKKTALSVDRIRRLEGIGFEWELRSRSK